MTKGGRVAYWFAETMVLSHDPGQREELRQYAAEALKGLYCGEPTISPFAGGRAEALRRLEAFDAERYDSQHGSVSQPGSSGLSPYIRHGLVSLREVHQSVVSRFGAGRCRGFILQLLWHVFWHARSRERGGVLALIESAQEQHGGNGAAPKSTECSSGETAEHAPAPAVPSASASPLVHVPETGLYCIDESLRQLRATGFIPFQARLWVAAYLLHWRGMGWREGYRLFQQHLVDADPVVNASCWLWVMGQLSGRAYVFNRANVKQHTSGEYCARCTAYRCPFEGRLDSVEERARKLGAGAR